MISNGRIEPDTTDGRIEVKNGVSRRHPFTISTVIKPLAVRNVSLAYAGQHGIVDIKTIDQVAD